MKNPKIFVWLLLPLLFFSTVLRADDADDATERKVSALLSQMTLEEKIGQILYIAQAGIKSIPRK